MADIQDIQEQLKALSDDFAAALPTKLDAINDIWQRVRIDNKSNDITELSIACHKLAGSGTSFGFKDVSENARALEIELNAYLNKNVNNEDKLWDDDTRTKFSTLIHTLLNQTQHEDAAEIFTDENVTLTGETNFSFNDKLLVYIQEKNSLLVDELTSKLTNYNYTVRNFSSINDLQKAILDSPPDIVIIDTTLFNMATRKIIVKLKNIYHFKIIHLANSSDFKERLEAVRIGVDYYFTKPVDFATINDTLNSLSSSNIITAAKVLIIDDSISTSQFHSLALKTVGIETKVVTDPFKAMDEVIDFKPDLILLDLHMPRCSGLELAAVIRQQKNYLSIPIIFLSGETDAQKQLETLETGADEFLTKPVNISHLIAVVRNKIIRYRELSSYMHNDSLTGLLNHTSIQTALETEIARAKREQSNLSYAMIDIDYFKKINDTYGHPMGDQVLKNISRFLKQNLRVTDYVGRYGGEEFVAILPGIDSTKAESVMQKILDTFSHFEFQHLNHKFKVTFSCGISDYETFNTAGEIISAADKALYEAKNSGRCCIKLAKTE